jgi:transcriptional regulator with XRE-family HTH domain
MFVSEETGMTIDDRLRVMREGKNISQGEVEKRTGLLRCYISRVENGHTVPAIEPLEKFARALAVPLHQVLYDGDGPPGFQALPREKWQPTQGGVPGGAGAFCSGFAGFSAAWISRGPRRRECLLATAKAALHSRSQAGPETGSRDKIRLCSAILKAHFLPSEMLREALC